MAPVIEVGHGEFGFCAAHTGRHPDGYEALHGHTFNVVVRLCGHLDEHAMVTDFGAVKAAVRAATTRLHRRTLVAAGSDPPPSVAGERVRFGAGTKHYDLPDADVVLLPVANTTTEAIADCLLEQVLDSLGPLSLTYAELTLAESPGVAATVRRQLG
jgi:6-pyruvoyl-tetrahydropterin synthase